MHVSTNDVYTVDINYRHSDYKFRHPLRPLSMACLLTLIFFSLLVGRISRRFWIRFELYCTTLEYSDLKVTPRVHGNEGRLEEACELSIMALRQ